MRMHLRHLPLAGLLAVGAGSALTVASPAVLAYPGVTASLTIISAVGCNAVPLGGTCTITAHAVTSEGAAVVGASISWTVTVPPGGSITPNPSTTDGNGNSTVTYHAPSSATASAPGGAFLASVVHLAATSLCASGTVTASLGGLSASTRVTVVCPGGSSTLLPVTSTGVNSSGGSRLALGATGLVALLVVTGGVVGLKRSRRQTA